MNFFKKLLGITNSSSDGGKPIASAPNLDQPAQKSKNANFELLKNEITGQGNNSYPFLSNHYSPNSRVPCKDFTSWIVEMIRQNDWEAVELLGREFIIANPGYAVAMSFSNEGLNSNAVDIGTDWIADKIKQISRKKFAAFIETNPNALLELSAMFVILSKKGGPADSLIFEEVKLLNNALCIYNFRIDKKQIVFLIEKANRQINQVKKELGTLIRGTLWEEIELFTQSEFEELFISIEDNSVAQILKKYPVTTRCSFFDLVGSHKTTYNYFTLANPTIYATRKYGIIEQEATEQLLNSDLFLPSVEISALNNTLSKSVLKEYFEPKKYELKKSWTVAKIIEFVSKTESGQMDLLELLKQYKIVKMNPLYKEDIEELIVYKEKLSRFFQLLCLI
jgi:hypothetical protein